MRADVENRDRLCATVLPGFISATIALAAFVVVYVNLLRETEVDGDWTYALKVGHLLDTGQNPVATSNTKKEILADTPRA